jgi:lauroyl/myristoyl acyltransferase
MKNAARKVGLFVLSITYAVGISFLCSLSERICLILNTLNVRILELLFSSKRKRNLREFYRKKNLSEDEIARLAEANIQYNIHLNAEVARGLKPSVDIFQQRIVLKGEEHLQAALREGRGVMLLGAHLGSFLSYHLLLGLKGYDITVVGFTLFPSSLERHTLRIAERANCKRAFTGKRAAWAAARVFRRNGILSVLFDIATSPRARVHLPLGGLVLPFDLGTARLAARFNVSVVPVISYITEPYHSEIHLEPAFHPVQGKDEKETVLQMTKQWSAWLERKVTARPDQWWSWPHLTLSDAAEQETP